MNKPVLAGIDIGGTKIAVALAHADGEQIDLRHLPARSGTDPNIVIETVFDALDEMLDANDATLSAIGIGCPSPMDIEKGLIMSPSNLRNWDRFPIVALFKTRYGVPVSLDNDANTAALGEAILGAGRGFRNIFYVTISTGIGGGIILDGNIYHGVSMGAGELGHTIVQPDGVACNCGSIGCLETICAGVHIARRTREKLEEGAESAIDRICPKREEISAKTVIEAVRENDAVAVDIWQETCKFLSIGIANSISMLAPEAVIVGGGISAAGDLLFEPLERLVPKYVSMVPADKINILRAELGSGSGVAGAVVLARNAQQQFEKSYVT